MIMRIIKWIISFFKRHRKEVVGIAAGAGGALAGLGAVNAHKAKKINKQALAIQRVALELYETENKSTISALEDLGTAKKSALDSFPHFADSIEMIQGRPKIKSGIFSNLKLPAYEPKELQCLSNDVQMAMVGAAGAGAGAAVGLAAFGAEALVAAPAAIAFGVVLCIKGAGLKKKSVENKRQAENLRKEVNEVVEFYREVCQASQTFTRTFRTVYRQYDSHLEQVDILLKEKNEWKSFSRAERKTVENTVLLARLLFEMCKVRIIVRQEGSDKLETVNSKELASLEKSATKLLKETTCTP